MLGLIIFEAILLPLATWRMYRLMAQDTGPKQLLRKLRILLGVKYATNVSFGLRKLKIESVDWSRWSSKDGSIAEGITCVFCSSIWWGTGLTMLLLFAPTWLYLAVALPLATSAVVIGIDNYARIINRR